MKETCDSSAVVPASKKVQLRINHHTCRAGCKHCFLGAPSGNGVTKSTREICKRANSLGYDTLVYATDQTDEQYLEVRDLTTCMTPNLNVISGDGHDNLQRETDPVGITLVSPRAEIHDSLTSRGHHAKTLHVLEQLRGAQANFDVWTVVYSGNYDALPEFFEFAREQGARAVFVNKLVRLGNGAKLPREYFLDRDQVRRALGDALGVMKTMRSRGLEITFQAAWGPLLTPFEKLYFEWAAVHGSDDTGFCPGGHESFGIEPESGRVTICNYIVAAEDLDIGHFDPERGLVLTEDWPYHRERIGEPCRSCSLRSVCAGGCRGVAILEHEALFAETDLQAGLHNCPTALGFTLPASWTSLGDAWELLRGRRGMRAIH